MMGEGLKRARATARPSLTVRGESDVARVKDCVNALAGIPDPEAFVRAADVLARGTFCLVDRGYYCRERFVTCKCVACREYAAYRKARGATTEANK